jgi:hypothetical protein
MQLKDFPLAWRWTDPNYAMLPDKILKKIEPQEKTQATALFEAGVRFCGTDGLDEEQFKIEQIETHTTNVEAVAKWLLKLHPETNAKVWLSWQPDTAVSTTWGIFSKYWDEFCYPASDDLLVWSENPSWVLLYHHEERFQHGIR